MHFIMQTLTLLYLAGALVAVRITAASLPADANVEHRRYDWISGRIAGGEPAQLHAAPWIVSMQWGFGNRVAHMCAGSIISATWVLTAAHCVGGHTRFGTFVLLAGRHNLRNASETATSEQRRNIRRAHTFRHPNYVASRSVGPWDLALIHVAPGFVFDAFVAAVALPDADRLPSFGEACTLHGWGSVSTTLWPSMPDALQTVAKPTITMRECKQHLPAKYLHESNVCTGPLSGGVSACGGDSGGPLTQGDRLVGVVSWGVMPCGSRNAPTVYVRVSAFVDWIRETTTQ